MPLKGYNQKIDDEIGIPLQDNYLLDDPEVIAQCEKIPELKNKGVTEVFRPDSRLNDIVDYIRQKVMGLSTEK